MIIVKLLLGHIWAIIVKRDEFTSFRIYTYIDIHFCSLDIKCISNGFCDYHFSMIAVNIKKIFKSM